MERNNGRFETAKLWNRDFSLLVTGQIVSIFGNMILSFALPLYILDISESAALFGLVLGLPYISLLIMSPIGGVMADRLRKQRIMFWLDLSTTVIIVLFMAARGLLASAVPIVIVKLMALNAIQGMYMPAVQASVPALAPSDKLVPANSITSMVNMLANMLAPAIAGILYSGFGLFPILLISAICFAITAVLDLLIRIPFKKQSAAGNIAQMIVSDISQSARFVIKGKPILAKTTAIMFLASLTFTSLLFVGLPVLITQNLGLSMALVGVNQSVLMVGGLVGGILAGVLGSRFSVQKIHMTIAAIGIFLAPIGLSLMFDLPPFAVFVIITAAAALALVAGQMCSIQLMAFIQGVTPSELIGKVMSIIMLLPFLASAFGMLLFGVLFERLADLPWLVIFAVVFVSILIAMYTRKHFRKVKVPGAEEAQDVTPSGNCESKGQA